MGDDSALTEDELIVLHWFSEEGFSDKQPLLHLRGAAGPATRIGPDSYRVEFPAIDDPLTERLRQALSSLISRRLLDLHYGDDDSATPVEPEAVATALADDANWLTWQERHPGERDPDPWGIEDMDPYYQVVPTEMSAAAYEAGMKAIGRAPYGCWPQEWTMGGLVSSEATN